MVITDDKVRFTSEALANCVHRKSQMSILLRQWLLGKIHKLGLTDKANINDFTTDLNVAGDVNLGVIGKFECLDHIMKQYLLIFIAFLPVTYQFLLPKFEKCEFNIEKITFLTQGILS